MMGKPQTEAEQKMQELEEEGSYVWLWKMCPEQAEQPPTVLHTNIAPT